MQTYGKYLMRSKTLHGLNLCLYEIKHDILLPNILLRLSHTLSPFISI